MSEERCESCVRLSAELEATRASLERLMDAMFVDARGFYYTIPTGHIAISEARRVLEGRGK